MEGKSVPTIKAALEGKKATFGELLNEAKRMARENPEDAAIFMEALDRAEQALSLKSGAATKEWLTTFVGSTAVAVVVAGVLSVVLQVPIPLPIEANAIWASLEAGEKSGARKRLLKLREAVADTVQSV